MTMIRRSVSGGRIRLVVGCCLAAAFFMQCRNLMSTLEKPGRTPGFGASVAIADAEPAESDAPETVRSRMDNMARKAPLDMLTEAQRWYSENVIDYTCTFRKQENITGKMTKVQTIAAKYRELNHSAYMEWVENPAKAKRVIYVEGKWTTKKGEAGALCEPAGGVAKFFVSSIVMPIHGPDAKAASRRTIDEFGFANALDLIIKYSLIAKERGELKLTYTGEAVVGDRPTYVFERVLAGQDSEYPDRALIYHLDKETLMPVLCASYADEAKQELLGQYKYTDVQFNTGLTDADFDGKTYGL